jgi:hypothetical protein
MKPNNTPAKKLTTSVIMFFGTFQGGDDEKILKNSTPPKAVCLLSLTALGFFTFHPGNYLTTPQLS